MLQKRDQKSFYFNGMLIDIGMLAYNCRNPNGARNHQRGTALCCLSAVASDLIYNYPINQETENRISNWLKELQ